MKKSHSAGRGLYFNSSGLPKTPPPEYVVWVDVMGTQARMSRSLKQTANFIFKLHVAALQAHSQAEEVIIYPVMDGFYASCPKQEPMLDFLRRVFSAVAVEFNQEANQMYQLIIRGCLAFGPTIHGRAVPDDASNDLANNKAYRDSILLGLPMVQAHSNEASAPPFGIFVHESARSFSPAEDAPLHELWWRWARDTDEIWTSLGTNLTKHLSWCKKNSMPLAYQSDRIAVHQIMVNQYFALDD